MQGKIIDMNKTDAFINFNDGTTMDVSVSRLPKGSQVGDTVNIDIHNSMSNMKNDKMMDFM